MKLIQVTMQVLAMALALCSSAIRLAAEDAPAVPPAPDAASLAAARDLMDVTGVTKQMDGMVDVMVQGFSKGAGDQQAGAAMTKEFKQHMEKFMSYKQDMLTDIAALYAETFTAAEMKEVADFYRSGTGAKFIAQIPTLMQKGSQIGIKYSQKAFLPAAGDPK
ncbi:MAG: DUF2059 domain-containing protein [Hyphomicrobium sp.]